MVVEKDNKSIKNKEADWNEKTDIKNHGNELATEFLDYAEKMRESYLKGVVDFIKWTSTVAVGAILWVSNTQNVSEGGDGCFAMISLLFFIFSLIVAIIVVYSVLQTWSAEWIFNETFGGMLRMFSKPFRFGELADFQKEKLNRIDQVGGKWLKSRKPETFNRLIVFHILFIMVGLVFYILSIQ